MMFKNSDYLFNLLRENKTYISYVKYEKIDRTMLAYINNVRKNDLVLNLKSCVQSLLVIIHLLTSAVKNNNSFLFVGNSSDMFINKIIRLTAEKSKQSFYAFSSKKLNYSKLKKDILEASPDFLIVLFPKSSLPLLKVAKELNIPVIGLCDVNYDSNYFTYFIPTNLSYRSVYLYSNIFVKALKQL